MTQQLIIDALRDRTTEVGPVRCYYGDWIVVYKGCEIARWDHHLNVLVVRRYTRPDRIYQCYMTAFFSACCEDVKYTQSQEYFADFAENNELEFYENGICIRHR